MPELPEVETIKIGLSSKIVGKRIETIDIETEKSFLGKPKDIIETTVLTVERRAKTIRIALSNGLYLLFHLKMTGQLIFVEGNSRFAGGHPSHDWHDKLPNKHMRITFLFNDGSKLFFNDLRKFGWCKVLTKEELEEIDKKFGREPFSKEFNTEYLAKRAQRMPQKTVKQFIMDQEVIAGVGNIYADESLFLAGILPISRVKSLKEADWNRLIDAIKKILKMGIKYGGTTDSDYVDIDGKKGGMQFHLNVYHRVGEPCPNGCKGVIEKTKVGGRGTYFCRSCQKELK